MKSSISEKQKKILKEYVVDHKVDKEGIEIIEKICKTQPKITDTLYRGHSPNYVDDYNTDNSHKSIRPNIWFSTSKSRKISENNFTNKTSKNNDEKCCLFIIHVEDVPAIDINYHIGDIIGDKKEEQEFIVLGEGGIFYQDKNKEHKGFKQLNTEPNSKYPVITYECWYYIEDKKSSPKQLDISKLKNIPKMAIKSYIDFTKELDLDSESESSVSSKKSLNKKDLQKINKKEAIKWIENNYLPNMKITETNEKKYIFKEIEKILEKSNSKRGGTMNRRKTQKKKSNKKVSKTRKQKI